MQLATSTWTEVDDTAADTALVPIGSTEQHGPHAPLATDTLAAEAVAEAGAAACECEVVVAPVLPVGVAEEHREFAGTLWISPETLRAYVRDVVRSLAANGWRNIVLVNGHGGNTDALREVAAALTRHEEVFVVAFTWFDAVDVDVEMGHAGAIETAITREHHPELIRDDRLAEAAAGASASWGQWVSGVNLAYSASEFSDSGVVGDPRAGPSDLGAVVTKQAAAALARLVEAVRSR